MADPVSGEPRVLERPPGGPPARHAITALDLVLASSVPDASADFYRSVLGAREIADAARWGAEEVLAFGSQRLVIRRAKETRRSIPKGIYDAVGLRVIALFVEDLEAACGRLEKAGRRVVPGIDLPGRLAIRFARDPDGNTLELIGLAGGACPPAPMQVGLSVRDADASRAFYAETLGWSTQPPTPIAKGITRHGFDVAGTTLKFWQPLGQTSSLPAPQPGAIGLDAVILRVAESGADAAGWTAVDPDGNRFEAIPD